VEKLWEILESHCKIETNQSCGTHVHLSPPEDNQWDLASLKSISRSILWFESGLEALVPESRRGNEYAKSNRFDNPKLHGKSGADCFQLIDQCANNVEIVNLMNNDGDRHYAWNFKNLYYGGKMTIEFRRAPGVILARHCLSWVELAAAFTRAARNFGSAAQLNGYSRDVAGLKNFISAGLVPGMNELQLMSLIFDGKSGGLEPVVVGPLSVERQQRLAKKKQQDQQKNLMVKKISAQPNTASS
jgi:Putative amidoligase enzyme